MRFMILRKADKATEAGVLPSGPLMAAMGKYMGELAQAGVLRAAEGLQASSKGARVKFSDGTPEVVEGPFAAAKDLVAGFCLIQVESKEEAIEWVKRWPPLDSDGEVEIEIRQVFEAEDFDPAVTPDMTEVRQYLRAHAEAKK